MTHQERAAEFIVEVEFFGTLEEPVCARLGLSAEQARKIRSGWERVKRGQYSSRGGWGKRYSIELWELVRDKTQPYRLCGVREIGEPPTEWTDTSAAKRATPGDVGTLQEPPGCLPFGSGTLRFDSEETPTYPSVTTEPNRNESPLPTNEDRIVNALEALAYEAGEQSESLRRIVSELSSVAMYTRENKPR